MFAIAAAATASVNADVRLVNALPALRLVVRRTHP